MGCVLECLLILVCSWNPSMTCDVCARADINADANTVMRTALLPHTCRYLFDVCAHSRTPPMSDRTGGRRASTFKLKHETDVCYLIHIRPRRRLRKRTLAGKAAPSRSYRAAQFCRDASGPTHLGARADAQALSPWVARVQGGSTAHMRLRDLSTRRDGWAGTLLRARNRSKGTRRRKPSPSLGVSARLRSHRRSSN